MEKPAASPLKKYRIALGETQEAFAPKIGVTPGQLSRIESGGTHSLEMALTLARVTGLAPADFAPPTSAKQSA